MASPRDFSSPCPEAASLLILSAVAAFATVRFPGLGWRYRVYESDLGFMGLASLLILRVRVRVRVQVPVGEGEHAAALLYAIGLFPPVY